MNRAYISIALGFVLIFNLHTRANSAEVTANELQDAELTGVVTTSHSGDYLYANGQRYQLMYADPEQKGAAQDFSGQRVRVNGQFDRGASQNLFWVDRVTPVEPVREHEWGRIQLEPHGYVNPADDQPRGDPNFRGKDVLDLPFRGPEHDSWVPKLHLTW